MDLITLVDLLEPHIIRLVKSTQLSLSIGSGDTGSMEVHQISGIYHTGQLDESQALFVGPKIANAIADHSALADIHHPRMHSILDTTHHFVSGGLALDLFGQSATSVIARITPSFNPGATAAILRTNTDGSVQVTNLITPLITSASHLTLQPTGDLYLAPTGGDVIVTGNTTAAGYVEVASYVYATDYIATDEYVYSPALRSPYALNIESEDGDIYLKASTNFVRMQESTLIQSDHFTSELTGWRITYSGEGDFRYIYSDQMKVKLFIADLSQALAGSEIITKSVSTLAEDFYVPMPGQALYIMIDDLPSAEDMQVFEASDFVRLRFFSRAGGGLEVTDTWGRTIDYADQADKKQRWTFVRQGFDNNYTIAAAGTRTQNSGIGTSINLGKVSGTSPGHHMFTFIVLDRAAAITPPAGWTLATDYASIPGMKAALYWKIAGGAEASSYTWSFSTSGYNIITQYTYTFAHSVGNPWGDLNVEVQSVASTIMQGREARGLSTQGDMVLMFGGILGIVSATTPSGMTELTDYAFGSTTMWVGHKKLSAAGLTGAFPATLSAAAPSVVFTLNLKPAYTLDLESGYSQPGTRIQAEAIVLDYGVSGNGYIEMTTVDGIYGSNSPYIRIVQWYDHPAIDSVTRAMMGNLRGIFGVDDEFGFYAGNGVTIYNKYMRLSNEMFLLNNIDIKLNTSGTQKVNIDAGGVDFWIGLNSGDKRLHWNGSVLAVKGALTITAASGFSGSGYLQIGTGTVNSTLSGWYMDYTGIYGQLSGVSQTSLTIQGKITAGAGNVYLDANGLGLQRDGYLTPTGARAIRWWTNVASPGSYALGEISVITQSLPQTLMYANVRGEGGFYTDSVMSFNAYNSAGSVRYYLDLYSTGSLASNAHFSTLGSITAFGGISETSLGGINVRIGNGGTPRIMFDDGTIVWQIDNFSGDFRVFKSGDVRLLIGAGGNFTVFGYLGESWNSMAFATGWGNYGSGWTTGQYKKFGDMVYVRGLVVRTSGVGTVIAQLPAGYRPSNLIMLDAMSNDVTCRLDVNGSGQITYINGGSPTAWVWMDHCFSVSA